MRVCVACMSLFRGGVGQQERAVFIQSVPCLYHVVGKTTGRLPVRSQRTQRPAERQAQEREREVGHRGWPRNLLVERASVRACANMPTELKNLLQGLKLTV